jgi:anti-sigma factor ChrR (cupin superfamily)
MQGVVFSVPQTNVVGENLVLRDHLIRENYRLDKSLRLALQEMEACDSMKKKLEEMLAMEEARSRRVVDDNAQLNESAKQSKAESVKWKSAYDKADGRRKGWRAVGVGLILLEGVRIGVRQLR